MYCFCHDVAVIVCTHYVGECKMVEKAMDVGVVVAIGVLSAVFIAALVALVIVLKKRYCKPADLISQQYRDVA